MLSSSPLSLLPYNKQIKIPPHHHNKKQLLPPSRLPRTDPHTRRNVNACNGKRKPNENGRPYPVPRFRFPNGRPAPHDLAYNPPESGCGVFLIFAGVVAKLFFREDVTMGVMNI